MMMKVCIVGAGAIGGFIGTRLALAGQAKVSALARGATLDALRTHGWRLRMNGELLTAPASASDDAAALGEQDLLIIALKGAPPELREKVFKNMSQRAAEMLREDLESRGPVRLSEVEAEQKEILKTARRLAEEGQIQLASKGTEDAFV
jgi:prephenate dehydrogenase